jgi:hypothetical protein
VCHGAMLRRANSGRVRANTHDPAPPVNEDMGMLRQLRLGSALRRPQIHAIVLVGSWRGDDSFAKLSQSWNWSINYVTII